MPGRGWTPEEDEIVRQEYGKAPMTDLTALAAYLGRSRKAVAHRARRLGINNARIIVGRVNRHAVVIDLVRAGFSDQEIAVNFGVSRQTIYYHRTTARLSSNRAAGNKLHIGLTSNWEARVQASADDFARESGWPTGLLMREVQILNFLARRGIPASRRDISDALEITHVAQSRFPRMQSRAGRGYLPHLISLGLVTRLKHMGPRRNPANHRGVRTDLFCLGPVALTILLERANEEKQRPDHREGPPPDASSGRCGSTQG